MQQDRRRSSEQNPQQSEDNPSRSRDAGPPSRQEEGAGQRPGMRGESSGQSSGLSRQSGQQGSRGQQRGALARRDADYGVPSLFGGGGPFALLRRMEHEMDRMFEQFSMGGFSSGGQLQQRGGSGMSSLWSPQIEVYERDGKLHVSADLPGLTKDDIEVNIDNDTITIQGQRQSQKEDRDEQRGFYRSERSYGSFYRAIPLPEGVNADNAQASFRDGVLDITLDAPKQAEGRGRRLQISDASTSTASTGSAEQGRS